MLGLIYQIWQIFIIQGFLGALMSQALKNYGTLIRVSSKGGAQLGEASPKTAQLPPQTDSTSPPPPSLPQDIANNTSEYPPLCGA
jgi:hypothetical protein